ncbi:DUF2637 domain-containing protein [Mycobacterium paraintracellulare]|uniref:DUF2637 domain-containing protein n=1 Tax=Mycobacterium paraintracellulare TaxID=1138383 RepID=UPI001929711F|nr:DUF2637 domain-containing protein [Mycobacterium paraintracellulare]BCP14037.1 hypothetical protein MINTM021_09460 [Mycobacterium paraintracellulare]
MAYDASAVPSKSELALRRRAVRFFWVVLIASSGASVIGNAMHAIVHAHSVPPVLAAAVATAPPLVLLGSTEGLSLLVKVRRRPTLTYWAALAMTLLLAAAAFRLSFDALRDLAVLCGIRPNLAWLWPLVVDVTITQATVSLLALSRQEPQQDSSLTTAAADATAPLDNRDDDEIGEARKAQGSVVAVMPAQRESATHGPRVAAEAVHAVIASNRTKQPPEVVRAILDLHAKGKKTTEICAQLNVQDIKLHHTTVSRIIATAMDRRTVVS